jgi:arylsulfatase A-like enzyme
LVYSFLIIHPKFSSWAIAVTTCVLTIIAEAAPRPNIIFILADDLGYGDLGVNWQNGRTGGRKFVTPKLDQVAAEGVRFTRHYCAAPICAPARASLLLGVHQGHANVRDGQFDKELENNHTLATVLKQAGYATAAIGKWGLAGSGSLPGHPLNRGFDFYFGHINHGTAHRHYATEGGVALHDGFTNVGAYLQKCYSTDLWTARAKDWIKSQRDSDPSRPFFLYLAYTSPHAQLQIPTQAYPAGGGLNGGVQWLGIDTDAATPTINTATGTIDSWMHPDYANAVDSGGAGWPSHAKRYATMVRRLDDSVGDLIRLLQDLGIDNSTLIVFSSDNGPHNSAGSGGTIAYDPRFFASWGALDGMKRDIWEGGVRMPTLARWPGGITDGLVADPPSQFHDWMPTFCELAGVPSPARSDGVSLVPTLTGSGVQRESVVYAEFYQNGSSPTYTELEIWRRGLPRRQMQFTYIGRYKGVRTDILNASSPFMVFDTLNDPKETTNLAGLPDIPSQKDFERRVLQVRRSGGGVTRPYDKEPVPSAASSGTVQGLVLRTFDGTFPWVPNFASLQHVSESVVALPELSQAQAEEVSGLMYSGWIDVPTTGNWSFSLSTGGAAIIRLNDAVLIDADNGYLSGTRKSSGSIPLQAGRHRITVHLIRRQTSDSGFDLRWSGPSVTEQAVPASAYFLQAGDGVEAAVARDDVAETIGSTNNEGLPVSVQVLANDSGGLGEGENLVLTAIGNPHGGKASIVENAIIYTPRLGFFGVDTIAYTISDGITQSSAVVTVFVIAPGNERWYAFDENAGLSTQETSGGRVAALSGFVDDPFQWIGGRHGNAIEFDGVDDAVLLSGYDGITGTNPRTFSAWVRTTATGDLPIIGWGPRVTGQKWIFMIKSGMLRIEAAGGDKQGTRVVNDGQWHHVAFTWENDGSPNVTDTQFYIDGVIENTVSVSDPVTINTGGGVDIRIGNDIQNRWFSGAIDDVRIYPRALSAAEISALHGQTTADVDAEAWSYRNLGVRSLTSAQWLSDPDADGQPIRLEYALGGSPHVPDSHLLPVLERANGGWTYLFNRRIVLGASTYQVEWSPDLKSAWSVISGGFVSPHASLTGFEQVRLTLPNASAPAGFLRLKIR